MDTFTRGGGAQLTLRQKSDNLLEAKWKFFRSYGTKVERKLRKKDVIFYEKNQNSQNL